jgi:hypothetical protein
MSVTWPHRPTRQPQLPRLLAADPSINEPAKRLWLILAAWDGPIPTPSQLAVVLDRSTSAVSRQIALLRDAGWIGRRYVYTSPRAR